MENVFIWICGIILPIIFGIIIPIALGRIELKILMNVMNKIGIILLFFLMFSSFFILYDITKDKIEVTGKDRAETTGYFEYNIGQYILYFSDGTAKMGDTIGGIMSISAVIVTGLAFYAQYRANDMVREQFKTQKFETQFYQRLKLHKENINEMEIEDKNKDKNDIDKKTVKGRTAFYEILKDLEKRIKSNNDINSREKFQEKIYSEFYKDYGGYISHYFRHLFHTVKFVVISKEKKIINEEEKKEYLQILRAQMSNDEQKLLFYNWLAPDYGGDWEYLGEDDGEKKGKRNSFFTEHKMLHNLWHDKLVKNKLINRKLEQLVRRHDRLGRKENLFEIGDDIDKNFS